METEEQKAHLGLVRLNIYSVIKQSIESTKTRFPGKSIRSMQVVAQSLIRCGWQRPYWEYETVLRELWVEQAPEGCVLCDPSEAFPVLLTKSCQIRQEHP